MRILNQQQYSPRLQVLIEHAQRGDAQALLLLGIACEKGDGVQENLTAAVAWYRLAVDAGAVAAGFCLGYACIHGRGTARSTEEAARWFTSAAEADHPLSQHVVALLYAQGIGVARDEAAAMHWYKVAMERSYREGLSSTAPADNDPTDVDIAARLYWHAAEQGYLNAKQSAEILFNPPDQHSHLAATEIDAYRVLAQTTGHPELEFGTATILSRSKGDHASEISDWYGRAAAKGHAEALVAGALHLLQQSPDTPESALKLLLTAAGGGATDAMMALGTMYMTGFCVMQDHTMARNYITQAAQNGRSDAMTILAMLWETGTGGPANAGEAARWEREAEIHINPTIHGRATGLPLAPLPAPESEASAAG